MQKIQFEIEAPLRCETVRVKLKKVIIKIPAMLPLVLKVLKFLPNQHRRLSLFILVEHEALFLQDLETRFPLFS